MYHVLQWIVFQNSHSWCIKWKENLPSSIEQSEIHKHKSYCLGVLNSTLYVGHIYTISFTLLFLEVFGNVQ